jgi:hypothetical protein
LRKQRFSEVWNSLLAAQQRGWVRRCPGCWAECEVLPNAFYSLDLLRTAWHGVPCREPDPQTAPRLESPVEEPAGV